MKYTHAILYYEPRADLIGHVKQVIKNTPGKVLIFPVAQFVVKAQQPMEGVMKLQYFEAFCVTLVSTDNIQQNKMSTVTLLGVLGVGVLHMSVCPSLLELMLV